MLHDNGATKTLTFGRIFGGWCSGPTTDDPGCFGTRTRAERTAALPRYGITAECCASPRKIPTSLHVLVSTCRDEVMLG